MTGKLTKAAIDRAEPKANDYFLWDGELKGFGIKIARGGRKSYVCKYRAGSGRSPYVFPAHRSDGHYEGTPKVWRIIRAKAGLEDVRLHDLRHSFASIAVSGGASLPIIGALLGHTNSATTQRYAHLHDDPLKAASEAVGNKIAASFSYDREGQLIGMDRS